MVVDHIPFTDAARQAHWMSVAIEKLYPPAPAGMITRKEAVDRYLREVFERTGKKITRGDFWRAAGYKNPTEFERWQRKDSKTNKTADANFRRILKEKPHLKLDPHRAVVKPLLKA